MVTSNLLINYLVTPSFIAFALKTSKLLEAFVLDKFSFYQYFEARVEVELKVEQSLAL